MAEPRGRIQRLDDRTAASVRGGQVIGSVARAVEELLRNSIEGGAQSCVVSVGPNQEVAVRDDGVGIEPEAVRDLVGTAYCSAGGPRRGAGAGGGGRKGESLRSIAALCVEMKIESACVWAEDNERKRKLGGSRSNPHRDGCIVRCEKVIKDGVVVSFHQSSGDDPSSAIIPTTGGAPKATAGTAITLRGLFHRHAVRRKHLENTSNSVELAQIRSTMRILALSHPTIAFRLENGSTGKVDCSYESPEWARNRPSLVVKSRALIVRLCDLYPDYFAKENAIELVLEEGRQKESSTFRAFGAMCIIPAGGENEPMRHRELEIVSINGRVATQNEMLADGIVSQVRRCRGNSPDCSARFFIHVSSQSGELVVKDSVATTSMPQIDRLQTFLSSMVANAILNSEHSAMYQASNWDSKDDAGTAGKGWMGVRRLVKSQQIVSTSTKAGGKKPRSLPPPPPSPFSSAFCDTHTLQPQKMNVSGIEMKPKAKKTGEEESSLLSFEDAFIDDDPKLPTSTNPVTNDFNYDFEDDQDTMATSTTWTRQRVKGLERTIAAIAAEANTDGGSGEKISLTKEMLETAEVIAQVEEKFIIIKTGALLCAVDQHAADERVALEKLENALFNPNMHDSDIIRMTHKSIMVSDILKSMALNPPKRISLTQKDMSTVKHHWTLLQKWKFTLKEDSVDGSAILLTGLPTVCDRPSSVNNFLEFVRELGHFTGGDMKPTFVRNILASNACRYAIMFGDSLSHEQCVELIASLSRCDFCFICAHGRPSVVPLVDMSKDSKPVAKVAGEQSKDDADKSLRSRPTRVIRRNKTSGSDDRHSA